MSEKKPEAKSANRRVRTSYKRRRSNKKKRKLRKGLRWTLLFLAIGIGLAFITYRILRRTQVNTAEAITSVEFDPLKEYDVIVEKGTADQKLLLLKELTASRQQGVELPVLADLYKKIAAASTELLKKENELNEEDRRYAIKTNIQALWKLYLLNIQNNVNDPYITDQFRAAIDKHSVSDDLQIAKAAQIQKMNFFTGETITRRNDFVDELTEAVKDSLQKFTLDGEFVESIRRLHTQLIAVNKDAAAAIVRTVKENQPDNDSPEYTSLVQHLGDLTALYDLGIGNLPSITDINTSIDDFYQRIETLARTPNVGETVYFQLANAIDYLETNRHHDQAIELGKVIADTAKSNPNEGLGKQGKKIGDDCAKRNSLIGSTWQFEESDVQGKNVSNEKFQGSVALIAFYADNAQTSPPFLRMMNSLERAFGGRNLQIVYVAVSDLEQGTTAQPALGHQNVLLKCSKSNPNQFLLQCPTDRFPYFILTDKESKVHSINVPARELKTRIESLL